MDSLEECEEQYQKGKIAVCFRKLLPFFLDPNHQLTMGAYQLMSKLLDKKSTLNFFLIKKARSFYENKTNLKELLQSQSSEEKLNYLLDSQEVQIYVELSLKLSRLLVDTDQLQEAMTLLNNINQLVQIIKNDAAQWLLKEIITMLDKYIEKRSQKQLDKPAQIEKYNFLLQEQEELEYFKQEGFFAYLLPLNWLSKWKLYVGYPSEQEEDFKNTPEVNLFRDATQDDIEAFHQVLGVESTTIEEEANSSEHPGPLDGSRFFEFKWDLLIDPFSPKVYQNYSLRPDLAEGRDFVLVSHKIFNFFKEIYGGLDAKRQIISHQHTKKTFVDVFNYNENSYKLSNVYSINVGSKENMECVTKKLSRILGKKLSLAENKFPLSRFWKFQNLEIQTDFIESILGKDTRMSGRQIKGALLEDKIPLEEMEVSETDVLIFEVKNEKEWALSIHKQINHITQSSPQINQQAIAKFMQDYDISPVPKNSTESRNGLTGLQNLGNTCFMNSALQCLSNVYELTEYMVSNQFVQDLNPKNPIGTKGFLASTYAELMKAIWFGKSQSVSAWELKRVIGKFAPQFYGYGQQDSQELLSYVLDGLHEDMNKILVKPQVEDITIDKETDQEAAGKFWTNYRMRNSSKIVDLAAGQFKSTLICPTCRKVSTTFDPFLSISLPIPSFSVIEITLYFIYADSNQMPLKINLNLSSDLTVKDVLQKVSILVKIPAHQLDGLISKEHKIKEMVKLTSTVKWIHDHEGMLFIHQVERRSNKLEQDETSVIVNYVNRSKGLLGWDEKALSFSRLVVIDRNCTLSQLLVKIYKLFRVHFLLCVKQLDEQAFPSSVANTFSEQISTEQLQNEIQQLYNMNKVPFTLKYCDQLCKNKSKEFTYQDQISLQSLPQELKIDLYIADFLKIDQLKLQRCKQFQGNEPSEPQTKKKFEYSVQDCLKAFTKEEVLGKGDEWYCGGCKIHVQATKKMEVFKAPQILILHLKRFKMNNEHRMGSYYFSGGTQKIGSLVTFPLQSFDLNQYVLSKKGSDPIDYTYDLFGVSNHFGGMGGGHYTAYAYSPIKRQWFDYNDSSVRPASPQDIVSEAAYLLFYRRRDSKPCEMIQLK